MVRDQFSECACGPNHTFRKARLSGVGHLFNFDISSAFMKRNALYVAMAFLAGLFFQRYVLAPHQTRNAPLNPQTEAQHQKADQHDTPQAKSESNATVETGVKTQDTFAQGDTDQMWLAGRYDGNRVVVYFQETKFGGTLQGNAKPIAPPVAGGFFSPVEVSANYLAEFLSPSAEHLNMGDTYDLILGNGLIATVKLTALVGCETDEQVGNESYIGALGTVQQRDYLFSTKDYY